MFNCKILLDFTLLLHKLSKAMHLQKINLGTERMVLCFYVLFLKEVFFVIHYLSGPISISYCEFSTGLDKYYRNVGSIFSP